MKIFPENETTFLLPGPVGDLEILTASIEDISPSSPVAVICHPHPLYSGTMNNKVVTTLALTFRDLGMRTVRFNFRGVGKSAGEYANGVGELDDYYAVIDWVKSVCPDAPIWLAGFSFGAYIATKAATEIPAQQLVCIAPPVLNFKMDLLPPVKCPWVVVQGEADEVISADAVFAWVETLDPKPTLIRMPGVSHFFHGKLLELRESLIAEFRG